MRTLLLLLNYVVSLCPKNRKRAYIQTSFSKLLPEPMILLTGKQEDCTPSPIWHSNSNASTWRNTIPTQRRTFVSGGHYTA